MFRPITCPAPLQRPNRRQQRECMLADQGRRDRFTADATNRRPRPTRLAPLTGEAGQRPDLRSANGTIAQTARAAPFGRGGYSAPYWIT